MAAVSIGGDRQTIHEQIRVHALAAAERLKAGASDNDLIDRLRDDPNFPSLDFDKLMDPRQFVGRSSRQVADFVAIEVEPIRQRYPSSRASAEDVRV
jgi:adenylosuccinate lyase